MLISSKVFFHVYLKKLEKVGVVAPFPRRFGAITPQAWLRAM